VALSIDHFLQDLQSEGELDSKGAFTLDFSKSKEKLAQFLLEKAEHILLKLVQAGVAAGAQQLDFESKTQHIKFTMYGAKFDFQALGQILNFLLHDEGGDRAIRHLAMAVNTAVSTRPTQIALACWDGRQGQLYRWSNEGRKIEPWTPPKRDRPVTHFQLLRTAEEANSNFWHFLSQRDILGMLLGTKKGWDPDRLMLHEMACWCPIPIRMNGRWMDPVPLIVARDKSTLQETPVKHKAEYRMPAAPGSLGIRTLEKGVNPWPNTRFPDGPVGAVMVAGNELHWLKMPSFVELVVDGVLVQRRVIKGPSTNQSFVRIVASADHCPTDFNGLRLREQEESLVLLKNQLLESARELFVSGNLGVAPEMEILSLEQR
jgi:hypothetical protein